MSEELERRDALRFAFLRRLYDVSGGSTRGGIQMEEIGGELGLDRRETARIVEYLRGEALVDWFGGGGLVGITHDGVREVEAALRRPDDPTKHFPPVVIAENYIQAQTITNSQFQFQTVGSTQQMGAADVAEISALIAQLRDVIAQLDLDDENAAAAEADLATASAQLESPRPKGSILKAVLGSAHRILERGVSDAVAPEIGEQVKRLGDVADRIPL